MTYILAFDLGSKSACALFDTNTFEGEDGAVLLTTEMIPRSLAMSKHAFAAKLADFVIAAANTSGEQGEDDTQVAYEQVYRWSSWKAARSFNSYAEGIDHACQELGIEPIRLAVGTWKKLSVGNGKASKAEVAKWARETYGVDGLSQDEYDAIGIGHAAIKQGLGSND